MGAVCEAKYSGRLLNDLTLGICRWKTVLNSVTTHHHLETGVLFAFDYFNASDQDITGCATVTDPPERSSIPLQ
jgi:hypothetical protein